MWAIRWECVQVRHPDPGVSNPTGDTGVRVGAAKDYGIRAGNMPHKKSTSSIAMVTYKIYICKRFH